METASLKLAKESLASFEESLVQWGKLPTETERGRLSYAAGKVAAYEVAIARLLGIIKLMEAEQK